MPKELQPVAHALIQAVEEADQATTGVSPADLWTAPGGAASVAWHIRHMAGALNRLFTYARGEALIRDLREVVEHALAHLRSTPAERLDDPRPVGRAQLPSTVRGLLHHAGEHTARHAAQAITTAKVAVNLRDEPL